MTFPAAKRTTRVPRLGLRANLAQFSLLVAVNALVGGMLGQERTVLPLLAEQEFGLTAYTSALSFILAFGATKAATNYLAGTLCDRYGRKPVLIAGWLIALPVPLMLIWAPSWGWVVAANVLLGVNQGLTWSTTVIMKIDLVGPERRGLAMGLNEAAGYLAVAATALATGYIAAQYGLRPEPFYLGIAYAALGLGLSVLAVRETREHARLEARTHTGPQDGGLSDRQVFTRTSFTEPALSSASQAGMVNNLNDGLAWGLFPVLFAANGLSVARIGVLAALYPAVWGVGQLVTGALSDRIGRKQLIVAGMLTQAVGLGMVALGGTFEVWAIAAVLLGAGTAMVYPTLLAVIGDVAHPAWRARSVGVYRLWRDSGFAIGALTAGLLADAYGIRPAVWAVAALTAASGLIVAARMYESHPPLGSADRPVSSVSMIDARRRQKIAEGRQAEIFAWEPGTVLKLFRGREFASDAQREATAMNAVHASGGPAPAALQVTEIDGRPALIMERIDGVDLLTVIGTRPWTLWRAASVMGEAHAALHATPAPDALPSLRPVLRRQIESPRVPNVIARAAGAAIDSLPDNDRLLHGDFHPGNIILTARGPAVIDWPGAMRGDPAADVARTVLLLRMGEPPPGAPALVRFGSVLGRKIILGRYLHTYRRAHRLSESELQRWLLPIAASRIAEGIDGERTKLLTWIHELMRTAS